MRFLFFVFVEFSSLHLENLCNEYHRVRELAMFWKGFVFHASGTELEFNMNLQSNVLIFQDGLSFQQTQQPLKAFGLRA